MADVNSGLGSHFSDYLVVREIQRVVRNGSFERSIFGTNSPNDLNAVVNCSSNLGAAAGPMLIRVSVLDGYRRENAFCSRRLSDDRVCAGTMMAATGIRAYCSS